MGVIALPQRHLIQPQYIAPIENSPLANGLVSAVIFDNPGSLVDRVTQAKYPVTSAATALEAPGRVLRFTGTASYVNTGAQKIGGVDLFASAGNPWSVVIYGRLISSAVSGSFIAKCGATAGNRQFQIYRDVTVANADPGIYLRGTLNDLNWDYNTELWHQYTVTWDGTTAKAYGDSDRSATLSVGAAAAESENIVFGARTGGTGFLLNGQLSYAYVYNRAISQEESLRLFRNPWQIFKAPSRRIWVAASTPSGDGVGSASGTSTVSGVGASIASSIAASSGTSAVSGVGSAVVESVGSASGTSAVDGVGASSTGGSSGSASGTSAVLGVGASSAASDGVANGVASVSGIGASTHAATGSADGIATVSGVGDSVQAGSAVGSASGSSTVSGVGASVVAAVGSSSGSSTVTGRGASTGGEVEDFGGGDDAPIIIRKRKKKTLREQPNKHLEHILNKAVEEFQGKVRTTLKLKKNKELEVKKPVLGATPPEESNLGEFDAIKTLEDSEKDAEKVAQLLAVYQQQVAEQDDEDLIMLIAEFF